ncbi:MAG: branched-chain-amino-acid transaminase [Candidatus Omnitrophica bacterium]|nr:branched-chain-amino-acid transaminase [Candidatus Omnitrophota bacterium]
MKILLNGKLVPKDKAVVSVFDHGLLYGDGVFEGIRAYNGLVFKLDDHIERLYESAHTLMLKIPLSQKAMTAAVVRTLQANRLKNAYIRVVVTRGVGDLGLDPRKCPRASYFVITDNIQLYPRSLYEKGLEIITVATTRNVPEAVNPQIKSLNYLNNILAKIEAVTSGYEEALMLSSQGFVAECTGENVFIIKNNRLLTPPAHLGLLKGITRQCVMELGVARGMEVREEVLTRHDIFNADEVFLTGTAAEIVPIVKVDNRTIGAGRPGPVTAGLLEAFHDLTRREGVRYVV